MNWGRGKVARGFCKKNSAIPHKNSTANFSFTQFHIFPEVASKKNALISSQHRLWNFVDAAAILARDFQRIFVVFQNVAHFCLAEIFD